MTQNQEKSSFNRLMALAESARGDIHVHGVSGSAVAYLAARFYRKHQRPQLLIAADAAAARQLAADLRFFLSDHPSSILLFPPYTILPFKSSGYHNETAAARIRALYRMIIADPVPIVVTCPAAVMQKLPPRSEISGYVELLAVGEEIDREGLIRKLVAGGYGRTMVVEEPGDFSVRGGIIDVFSPMYPDPIRMELFDDWVESLRFFSPASQRTLLDMEECVLLPIRELILENKRIDRIISGVRRQAAQLEMRVTDVRYLVEHLRREESIPGVESFSPLAYDALESVVDYLPQTTQIILTEPAVLSGEAENFWDRLEDNFQQTAAAGRFCLAPQSGFLKWPKVQDRWQGHCRVHLRELTGVPDSDHFQFEIQSHGPLRQDTASAPGHQAMLQPLVSRISSLLEQKLDVVLTSTSASRADRLSFLLESSLPQIHPCAQFPWERGSLETCLYQGVLSAGFVWPGQGLAIIAEDDIFGRKLRRKPRRSADRRPAQRIVFGDLKGGDLVVHSDHGIGRYQGLTKLTLDGNTNDFLLIHYRDDDRLYLPVDRISMIQKYMGVDGMAPKLDKMGGKSWERVKARVKESVEKMAVELLNLYAARKVEKGHRFGRSDSFFQEFEDSFRHEETPDQRRAIEDVLRDMESPEPMDRLICGDVGFGKTEVAMRAAFKAANDGKQVAVLVPTTVLAEQHGDTFRERFQPYPVQVACLSRFRSAKEQRQIVAGLAEGRIDIVIGTHRLIQKDVHFKDLGLIVVDEEQRFGVRHKERLKQMRQTVDVLALTATPIPRTLHMSLMGVRDISVITTPPEHRQSIVTYISEYDETLIAEAVKRELARGGQIYFVHNMVHNIWKVAHRLRQIVPEAKIGVAHGQMDEKELEDAMLQFSHHETDLLVCTSIVESGLDIASANTMIVNRADRFGLAQMYQLRGRVGRSHEQAYAYLFIPDESRLSRDARKRLKVLMEHSDIGAGYQIAMSDLQIRGGGSILGCTQSGHVAAVGYETFLELMENSVAELKGRPISAKLEPEINLPLSAYIPEDYIPEIDQRLSFYRRLARMTDLGEISDLKAEMADRFGPLPQPASNLLLKIMLRVLCVQAAVGRLDLTDTHLQMQFSTPHLENPQALVDWAMTAGKSVAVTPDQGLKVERPAGGLIKTLGFAKKFLKEVAQHGTR